MQIKTWILPLHLWVTEELGPGGYFYPRGITVVYWWSRVYRRNVVDTGLPLMYRLSQKCGLGWFKG